MRTAGAICLGVIRARAGAITRSKWTRFRRIVYNCESHIVSATKAVVRRIQLAGKRVSSSVAVISRLRISARNIIWSGGLRCTPAAPSHLRSPLQGD